MRTVTPAEAQAGDIVAEAVVNEQGRTVLPAGSRLSAAVLSRLEKWGVHELVLKGDEPAADAPAEDAEETAAEEAGDRLAALDERFEGWEGDEAMMRIKQVARRHLASLGGTSPSTSA
jgi:hypothetical protein